MVKNLRGGQVYADGTLYGYLQQFRDHVANT